MNFINFLKNINNPFFKEKKIEPVYSLGRKPEKTVDWAFVTVATCLTLFFGILVAMMLTGFKCVESGLEYNEVILCILNML